MELQVADNADQAQYEIRADGDLAGVGDTSCGTAFSPCCTRRPTTGSAATA